MKKSSKKIIISMIFWLIVIFINGKVNAASISISPSNPKVGDTVTITVTVPNVNTASVTANVTGAVTGNVKVVGGDLSGNASTYTKSESFKCEKEGTINVSVSNNSTAVLNGNYVDVKASASVKVSAKAENNNTSNNGNSSNNGASNNGSSSNSSNGSSSSNTSNGNSSGNSTQRPSTSTETKKSSNANLKDLGIKPNDFKGFKSGTTAYNVTVPNDVEQVKVYATAQDSKSKITGTGNKKLTVGKNKLDVVVTAEDGTTKTYTINVTREEAAAVTNETTDDNSSTETQENTQNNTTEDNTDLKNLTISGYTLTPSFSPNVYEYKLDVKGDISSLDIQTEGANHSVSTDIAGNENLKDGENIITIHVYNEETKKNSTYQIIVNKMTASSEDLNVTLNNAIKKANKIRYIFFGTVLFIVIASIVFIIVRHNIKKDDDEDKEDDDEIYDYNKKENERLNLDDEDELFSRVNKDEKKGKHF